MANDTYTASADGSCFAGRFKPSNALAILAASISAGDIVEMTSFTGLNDGLTPYPNEGGSNDFMHDWCIGGVWDKHRKRAYVIGAPNGKLSDGGASSKLLIYDAIADNWFSVTNPINGSVGHCYDSTAYHNARIYKRKYTSSGGISVLDADTLLQLPNVDMPSTSIGGYSQSWVSVSALCVVPTLGSSGSLIMLNGTKVVAYDLAAETWSYIAGNLTVGSSSPTLHYNAASGKLVAGCSGTSPLYLIDPVTLSVVETDAAPINIFLPGTSSFVEYPNSHKSICYGTDGNYHILNTLTGVWETSPMPAIFTSNPSFALQSLMVTIPEYDVILIEYYSAGGDSRVFLHKLEH